MDTEDGDLEESEDEVGGYIDDHYVGSTNIQNSSHNNSSINNTTANAPF